MTHTFKVGDLVKCVSLNGVLEVKFLIGADALGFTSEDGLQQYSVLAGECTLVKSAPVPPKLKDMPIGVPFVYNSIQTPSKHGWVLVRLDEQMLGAIDSNGDVPTTLHTNSTFDEALLVIVDWFEESATTSGVCTCDFYSVVLRVGCQCGGK